MKRSRDKDSETLTAYLQSPFVRSACYATDTQCFTYQDEQGVPRQAAGLLSFLRATYYPHYVEGAVPLSGKAWKHGKPSSVEQGIRVDNDMEALVRGGRADGLHPLSAALLAHWQAKGHSVVAAQVPVRIDAHRMTRADVITRHDLTGKLWLWEVKTGMSASLRDKQGTMRAIPGAEIPCNKANCWQLQCEYTRRALVEQAGLPIAGARVIQVYEGRKRGAAIEVKEHRTAPWLKQVK